MAEPSNPHAFLSEIELREEIAFQQVLLESLGHPSIDREPELRQSIEKDLQDLRREIRARQPPLPFWATMKPRSDHPTGGSHTSNDSPQSSNYNSSNFTPAAFLTLPTRKRQRLSDDDDENIDYPETKPKRPSPSPAISNTPSPANSYNSFDLGLDDDDPLIQSLLGSLKNTREAMKDLERRRRQEAGDAAYARELAESFVSEHSSSFQPHSSTSNFPNYAQATIRSNGTVAPPVNTHISTKPELGLTPLPSAKPHNSLTSRSLPPEGPSPISVSDSDSDVEEISVNDFYPHRRRNLPPPSFRQSVPDFPRDIRIPGAFPGSPYAGIGGTSVYGLSSYSVPSQSAYGTHVPGSSARPLDVEGRGGLAIDMEDYYANPARTQEEIKELLKQIRPDEDIDARLREGTPDEMKCDLYEHQKLGLTWMKKMEDGSNKGGLLADDMGLGKTLQAIALIVSRPPPRDARKPTLIVAPVALIEQWKREIHQKLKPAHRLSVMIVHGSTRHVRWQLLKEQDVIITTYGTLASELKRKLAFEDRRKLDPDAIPDAQEQCSILGDRSFFHRVILDEAQWIKNRSTKVARACCYIQSQFRWCMSGTPMQNNVEELYSLIKFCQIKPYNEWDNFARDFARPLKNARASTYTRDRAMRQLQILLRAILLRRTKTSEIDGEPIVQLPPKTTHEARAVFSKDEREFYQALEQQTMLQFNRYVRAGTVGRNYSNILVLLLRLRQACCHPHLVKDFGINTGGALGLNLIANAEEMPKDVVERVRQIEAFECPACMDAEPNPILFKDCGHALCDGCLSRMADAAATENNGNGAASINCPNCRRKIDTNKVTDFISFQRVFCPEREGIEPLEEDNESANGTDTEESSDEDEDAEDDGEDLKNFIVPDDAEDEFEDSDGEVDRTHKKALRGMPPGEGDKKKNKGKGKKKAKKSAHDHKSLAQLRREGLKNKAAKKKYIRRLERDWQPSAKIEKTLALLEDIHNRGQEEKTIIFSGFTSFLDLLEVPLARNTSLGDYTRYDGSMSATARNDAVLTFTHKPACKIMLVSLKAGNSGLNLTAANHVIILDPHWNPYVEFQAQDRCYRIGQLKEVQIHRVLIDREGMNVPEGGDATVEDRILKLQEKKKDLVDSALDETAGRTISRLGVTELGYLFGVNSM